MERRNDQNTGHGWKARKVCHKLFGVGVENHELAVAHVREVKTARSGIEAGVIEASGTTRQRDVGHFFQEFRGATGHSGGERQIKRKEELHGVSFTFCRHRHRLLLSWLFSWTPSQADP